MYAAVFTTATTGLYDVLEGDIQAALVGNAPILAALTAVGWGFYLLRRVGVFKRV